MPMSRAMARSVTASGPSSTRIRRAVSVISLTVAARSRSRRVSPPASFLVLGRVPARPSMIPQKHHCRKRTPNAKFTPFAVNSDHQSSWPSPAGETTMFDRWGRWVHRRRRRVLAAAGAALVFAGVWGTGVFGALSASGGFDTPGSESAEAARIAERDLGRSTADVVVLYEGPMSVD